MQISKLFVHTTLHILTNSIIQIYIILVPN